MISADLERFVRLHRLGEDLRRSWLTIHNARAMFEDLGVHVSGEDAKFLAATERTAKRIQALSHAVDREKDWMMAAVDGKPILYPWPMELDRMALEKAREIIDRELKGVRE